MEVIYLALIAAGQLLAVTVLQGILVERKEQKAAAIRRAERAEDYARQDLVAERAALVAKEATEDRERMTKAQTKAIAGTQEVARLVAESHETVQKHLSSLSDQAVKIHILVNSDMTAALTNERDQAKLTLDALQRVQALSVKLGIAVRTYEIEAIERTQTRIAELDVILVERHAAQAIVDTEAYKKEA